MNTETKPIPPAFTLTTKEDNTQVWLNFKGGEICLNNIAENLGPITSRNMQAAIAGHITAAATPPAQSIAESVDTPELDRLARKFIACVQREQIGAGQVAWKAIIAHIASLCEDAVQHGYAAGMRAADKAQGERAALTDAQKEDIRNSGKE